jgi:thiol-disulfide isomerase/thioredoxin
MKTRSGPPVPRKPGSGARRPARPAQPARRPRPPAVRPTTHATHAQAGPARSGHQHWFWWIALGVLVAVGGASVALAGGGGGSSSKLLEISKSVKVDGTTLPTLVNPASDPAVGRTAPGLSGENFSRQPVAVTNDGKAHVVVFVAHWCPHCQAEVPRIVAMAQAGETSGVAVTGVATGTNENAANYPPSAWLKDTGWPSPVLVDTASGTAAKAYGLAAYPYLVFVDANGKVAARVSGEVAPADLAKMFSALAGGRTVPIPASAAASAG